MSAALMDALEAARKAFAQHLSAYGVDAAHKRRTAATRRTGGAISEAAHNADPLDEAWVRALNDPMTYTDAGTVRIIKDVPSSMQADNAGMMITGTTVAYAHHEAEIAAGDALIIGGEPWRVDGARVVAPPAYLEITLRRGAA